MGGKSIFNRVAVGVGCWEWQGPTYKRGGHGQATGCGGKHTTAHRLAFEEWHGRPPEGQVNHTCDNPVCCRPSHLKEGTHSDNMRGRADRTWRPPRKLTEEQVQNIMNDTRPNTHIAPEYGVTDATISNVRLGKGAYARK